MKNSAAVSFVIPNWNGREDLTGCVESILSQTCEDCEIIIIDNASEDGSGKLLEDISARHPKVNVIFNLKNEGFCRAINLGISVSRGDFVVFMNPDVTLSNNYVVNALECFADSRVGSVAGKLLNASDRSTFDSTGLFLDPYRRTFDRGQLEKDIGQYEEVEQIFCAPGGLAMHRREMLEDVMIEGEVLDEDFFAYYDDADLGWRSQLLGWKCIYIPIAVAYHARGGENTIRARKDRRPSLAAQIMSVRNRYLMMVKNDSLTNFLFNLPYLIAYEIARTVYLAIYCPGALAGVAQFIALMRRAVHKRGIIQKEKRVPDSYIKSFFKMRNRVNRGDKTVPCHVQEKDETISCTKHN